MLTNAFLYYYFPKDSARHAVKRLIGSTGDGLELSETSRTGTAEVGRVFVTRLTLMMPGTWTARLARETIF